MGSESKCTRCDEPFRQGDLVQEVRVVTRVPSLENIAVWLRTDRTGRYAHMECEPF